MRSVKKTGDKADYPYGQGYQKHEKAEAPADHLSQLGDCRSKSQAVVRPISPHYRYHEQTSSCAGS